MTQVLSCQRGMALVVVLVLVATSSVLAVAGMQSTLTNERIVGNYRAAAQARREAEAGVVEFYRHILQAANSSETGSKFMSTLTAAADSAGEGNTDALKNAVLSEWLEGSNADVGHYRLTFEAASDDDMEEHEEDAGFRLVSEGVYGASKRLARYKTEALVRLPRAREDIYAFDGLMSCEGVSVRGSGIIDSYDAREGAYGSDNARRRNVTIGASASETWVTTIGSSPIYGEVKTGGGFRAQGSGSLHGNLQTNGPVQIQGGGSVVYGNVFSLGDVDISSSGTVQGNVATNGTLYLGNWSAWIGGDAVAAAAESVREAKDQVGGSLTLQESGAGLSGVVASGDCPTYDVAKRFSSYSGGGEAVYGDLSLGGGRRTVVLYGAGLHDPNSGTQDIVTELDDGRQLAHYNSLRLGGSANLRVGSPGNPVDMVLWVPGEINIGGGGSFRIAEGSRLTIVTASPFDLGSGIQMADDSPSRVNEEGNVEATLTLISTYDDQGDSQPGVKVRGASSFYGQIIAPHSRLDIGGSGGFYGAANARWIDVSGSGGFHYDESFGEVMLDAGPEGDGAPGSSPKPRLQAMW